MKKLFAILVPLVFVLSACMNDDATSNTISVVELTDRENAILSTISDQSFVLDFSVDKEYEEVSVWIEKYESGKLVNDQISFITTGIEENGSIIFATSKEDGSQKHQTFNIGISSNGSTGSISGFDPDANDLEGMSSVSGHFPEESISINEEEVVLASICYSSDGAMSSLSTDFYKDIDSHIEVLEKYDVVYLLKTEFKK